MNFQISANCEIYVRLIVSEKYFGNIVGCGVLCNGSEGDAWPKRQRQRPVRFYTSHSGSRRERQLGKFLVLRTVSRRLNFLKSINNHAG